MGRLGNDEKKRNGRLWLQKIIQIKRNYTCRGINDNKNNIKRKKNRWKRNMREKEEREYDWI